MEDISCDQRRELNVEKRRLKQIIYNWVGTGGISMGWEGRGEKMEQNINNG